MAHIKPSSKLSYHQTNLDSSCLELSSLADCCKRCVCITLHAVSLVHGTTSPQTRRDVAVWVDRAMAEIKSKVGICCNAWLKTGYEWFPKVGGQEEGNIGGNDN